MRGAAEEVLDQYDVPDGTGTFTNSAFRWHAVHQCDRSSGAFTIPSPELSNEHVKYFAGNLLIFVSELRHALGPTPWRCACPPAKHGNMESRW